MLLHAGSGGTQEAGDEPGASGLLGSLTRQVEAMTCACWGAVPGATYRVHFGRVIELQPGHHAARFQHGSRALDVLHLATFLHVQGHDHLHHLVCGKKIQDGAHQGWPVCVTPRVLQN